ncbi:MAG: sigma-70 family RNA polymerase sigma factor, partial [Candidatus Hydrogenedentales bacterium]
MLRFGRNDAVAVRRALTGDRNAFARLVDRHDAAAVALAYARLRTRADAEDAAQEAWVQAYESLSTLRDPAKFGPWFAAIVRHCAARISTRRVRELAHREQDGSPEVAHAPDPAARELRAHVRNAVEALDEPLREAVLLHYFAGQSSREIGAMLDVPAATIRKRLQRARERLGEQLLTDVAEEFRPSSARTKRIMGLVAASAPAWQSSRESAAVLAQPAAGGGAVKAIAAGVLFTGVLVGGGWWWLLALDEPAQVLAQGAPAVEAREAVDDFEDAPVEVAPTADSPADMQDEPVSVADAPAADIRTATLRGIVITSDGEPAPGADVRVKIYHRFGQQHDAPDMLRKLQTDDQGRFVVAKIPMLTGGWSTAALDVNYNGERSYQRVSVHSRPVWDSEWVVKLRTTEPIAGRITNSAGDPVHGAVVRPVEYEADRDYRWIEAEEMPVSRSGDDGRFTFDGLYVGRWKLLTMAPGYAPAETWANATAGEKLEVVLSPGAKLAGRVSVPHGFDVDKDPLWLRLQSETNYRARYETAVSSEGSFAVDDLRPGEFAIRLGHPELVLEEEGEKIFIGDTSRDTTHEFTAVTGGVVTGRVFDAATGLGLRDVPIRTGSTWQSATTNDFGEFELRGLPPGEYELFRGASANTPPADPSTPTPAGTLKVGIGESVGPIEWPVHRDHVLSGLIVDEAGQPAQNASILIYSTESESLFGPIVAGVRSAQTDENGRYQIYLRDPTDNVHIQAAHEDRVSRVSEPIDVDGPTPGPTLELEPAGAIAGRIVDADGRVTGPTQITVHGERSGFVPRMVGNVFDGFGQSRTEILSYTTNANEGYFYVGGLPADTYTIDTRHNATKIFLGPGERRLNIEIPLYSSSAQFFTGKVLYQDRPLPNAQVSSREKISNTGADGEFRLPYSGETDYISAQFRRVADGIQMSRWLDGEVQVKPGEEVVLQLGHGTATIEGKVVINGKPRPYTEFRLTYPSENGMEESVTATTNDKGEYRLEA